MKCRALPYHVLCHHVPSLRLDGLAFYFRLFSTCRNGFPSDPLNLFALLIVEEEIQIKMTKISTPVKAASAAVATMPRDRRVTRSRIDPKGAVKDGHSGDAEEDHLVNHYVGEVVKLMVGIFS